MLRGHYADDNLRTVERGVQIAGRCNRFWQDEPGQKALVDPVACDALGNFGFVGPEPDMMSPGTPQDNCQRRAPGAGADDGNAAHRRVAPRVPDFISDLLSNFLPGFDSDSDADSLPEPVPNFDSVPAARRPMFRRCLQMTRAETRAIKTSCHEPTYSWRAHASSGKAAATATEPS